MNKYKIQVKYGQHSYIVYCIEACSMDEACDCMVFKHDEKRSDIVSIELNQDLQWGYERYESKQDE